MLSNKYISAASKYIFLITTFLVIKNAWPQDLTHELKTLGIMIPKGFDSSVQIQYQCNSHNKYIAKKCLIDLYEFKDNGKYKHDSLNINLQSGYEILDTNDTNCVSTIQKDTEIIAIGKLKQNKFKFIAHDIIKAWVINPKLMIFKSIERGTVSCAIIDDRN
ncbi:hypothetical protein B9Z51_17485 [Limnohabitans sp. T6-5]|uniref:hypothetical protein n=1 Tax=Limnohabitans sp. T6-5 TaxID=1100724 RepID=UPI000D34E195|nr:hypothetical protein [Limnohabitans sp. T6-5]PUE06033.1 hypothetical protein B9Z51_17485 [Limnohabitans sp. T6-5]